MKSPCCPFSKLIPTGLIVREPSASNTPSSKRNRRTTTYTSVARILVSASRAPNAYSLRNDAAARRLSCANRGAIQCRSMSRFVCYIPSYNDSTLVAQSLASVPEWEVVISDNTSNRDHALAIEQLSGPLVRVVHQPRQLGRVGNWKLCVEHFLASGATWMKFLMAGDRLKPNSLSLCRRAVSQFPDVRSIVFNVEIVNSQGATRWSTATQPRVLAPRESMLE